MLRLLIEDVTLQRTDQLLVHVRFRGGATKTLELERPLPAWALRQTSTQVVAAVDKLIAHYTDEEIAEILNERGMRSGEGRALHWLMVRRTRLAEVALFSRTWGGAIKANTEWLHIGGH